MTERTASSISQLMISIGTQLDASLRDVSASESEGEATRYRASISKILTTMLVEIMNPIYQEYPHLKPTNLE